MRPGVYSYIPQEDIEMSNRYIKMCPLSLIIMNIQIKTVRCHLTPMRMAHVRKSENSLAGRVMEKLPFTANRNAI